MVGPPAVRMLVVDAWAWAAEETGEVLAKYALLPVVALANRERLTWGKTTSSKEARLADGFDWSPRWFLCNGWTLRRRGVEPTAMVVDDEFGLVHYDCPSRLECGVMTSLVAAPWDSSMDLATLAPLIREMQEEAIRREKAAESVHPGEDASP